MVTLTSYISKNINFEAHTSAQKEFKTSLTYFVRSCALIEQAYLFVY